MHEDIARVSRLIHARPREVWSALTSPLRSRAFFRCERVVTTWGVGCPVHFIGQGDGETSEDSGVVLAAEPDEALSFTRWSALSGLPHTVEYEHTITITLVPDGESTVVTVTQARPPDLAPAPTADERDQAARDWNRALGALAAALELPAPVPDVELGGSG